MTSITFISLSIQGSSFTFFPFVSHFSSPLSLQALLHSYHSSQLFWLQTSLAYTAPNESGDAGKGPFLISSSNSGELR